MSSSTKLYVAWKPLSATYSSEVNLTTSLLLDETTRGPTEPQYLTRKVEIKNP